MSARRLLACIATVAVAGCQGAEIATSAVVAHGPAAGADGSAGADSVDSAGGVESLCVADSDCAPLAASSACLLAVCDVPSGRCLVGRRPDGASCDDGEPCSAESACAGGACQASVALRCDDGNPCTKDSCAAGLGCQATPQTLAPCDDGNPCTVDDRCQAGACVAAQNLCGCADDGDCDDLADLCHGGWVCAAGGCAPLPGQDRVCDDGNPCTHDSCLGASGCVHVAAGEGGPCSDGDVCTASERCIGGLCVAAAKLPCGAAGPGGCVASACDAKLGCVAAAGDEGAACDDGDACTAAERCEGGACVGVSTCACAVDADCAVGPEDLRACAGAPICRLGRCERDPAGATPCAAADGPCERAVCGAKGCAIETVPQSSPCDDGDPCTGGDSCDAAGACQGGTKIDCDDGVDCTQDACIPSTGCLFGPSSLTLPCDDGNACTAGDACDGLQCRGAPTGCDDGDPCTTDFCQPVIAACAHAGLPEGAACVDGDPCTADERCLEGLCAAKTAVSCDDGDLCTADACDGAGACVHTAAAEGIACSDGDPCTADDSCAAGVCAPGASTCACKSAADCKDDEDGDACNGTLHCVANVCVVDPGTVVSCALPDNPCLQVACVKATGICQQAPAGNGAACDDGDACTVGEACGAGGVCIGGDAVGCDDGDICTIDSCDAQKGCGHVAPSGPTALPCDDGNPCTYGDACGPKGCTAGSNGCQCQKDADCAALDDTDLCTPKLVCASGSCKPSAPKLVCDPSLGGPCVDHLCPPTVGKCTLVPRVDGVACKVGAGPGCVGAGLCAAGQCETGAAIVCDDGNACSLDQCPLSGVCAHLPATAQPCDDGDLCSKGDSCSAAGVCQSGALGCDDGNPCTGDACDPQTGACSATPLAGFATAFSVDTGGLQLTSNNAQVAWSLDGKRFASPSKALYIGRVLADGTGHSYDFGLTLATATLPTTAIPAGVKGAFLRMKVYFDSGESGPCGPTSDRVAVLVGAGAAAQVCGDTGGFVDVEVDLSAQAGQSVAPVLSFFANGQQNAGEGAWIDDVELGWTCTGP